MPHGIQRATFRRALEAVSSFALSITQFESLRVSFLLVCISGPLLCVKESPWWEARYVMTEETPSVHHFTLKSPNRIFTRY
jgi:hypothetical protein